MGIENSLEYFSSAWKNALGEARAEPLSPEAQSTMEGEETGEGGKNAVTQTENTHQKYWKKKLVVVEKIYWTLKMGHGLSLIFPM